MGELGNSLPSVPWMLSPFVSVSCLASNWSCLTYTSVSNPVKFGCWSCFGWITDSWSTWGKLTQTHPCRNSGPLMPMFAPMDSILSWTMRKRKKMRRSEDFLVYNDWLCIEFNKFFVDTWAPTLCKMLDFTNFHFTSPKKSKTSWSFTSRKKVMRSYSSRKLHFTSFNEVMA